MKVFHCHIAARSLFSFVGIRSQSRPQDIMAEVYRAMLQLGYVSWILVLHMQDVPKRISCLNSYREGAINQTFPLFKFLNRRGFKIEFCNEFG